MRNTLRERYLITRRMVQKAIREYNEKPALRAYLEIFLTLAAISLFGIFAIRPTAKTIGSLLKEIDAKEETLKIMDEKIDNLNAAKDLYTREEEKIKLLDEAIPRQPKPETIALQIEQLSNEKGVSLEQMSIEGVKILGEEENEDQTIALTLGVSGSYLNLINFAEGLENLRRPVKYDALTLVAGETREGKSLTLGLNNLMTVYMK